MRHRTEAHSVHDRVRMKVRGILSAQRYVAEPLQMIMGGERKTWPMAKGALARRA